MAIKNKEEIGKTLADLGITKYKISKKGKVDVTGNVDISGKGLKKIPVKFGVIKGEFYCENNQLKSLKGSPRKIFGTFYCYENKLKSLKGSPNAILGDFNCRNNKKEFSEEEIREKIKITGTIYK